MKANLIVVQCHVQAVIYDVRKGKFHVTQAWSIFICEIQNMHCMWLTSWLYKAQNTVQEIHTGLSYKLSNMPITWYSQAFLWNKKTEITTYSICRWMPVPINPFKIVEYSLISKPFLNAVQLIKQPLPPISFRLNWFLGDIPIK